MDRRLLALILFFLAAPRSWAESRSDLRLRVAGDLLPGATRAGVLARLGRPERQDASHLGYATDDGWVTLAFDRDGIREAVRTRNRGPETDWLYSRMGAVPGRVERARLQALVDGGKVASLRHWGRTGVRTHSRQGLLFQLPIGLALVEEMCGLPCAYTPYADAVSRVTILRLGVPDCVVYRAWDNWASLRPPKLTDAALAARIAGFRTAGSPRIPVSVTDALGPADTEMGSGMGYRLYWITDGLLTVGGAGACVNIALVQPGAAEVVSYAAWLGGRRPGHEAGQRRTR